MSRFFKELLEVHADRWRYMFGVGSFWSIFIPLIIVAALDMPPEFWDNILEYAKKITGSK